MGHGTPQDVFAFSNEGCVAQTPDKGVILWFGVSGKLMMEEVKWELKSLLAWVERDDLLSATVSSACRLPVRCG